MLKKNEKILFSFLFLILIVSIFTNIRQNTQIDDLVANNYQINEKIVQNSKYLEFLRNNFDASLRQHYRITYWRTNVNYPPDDRGNPYALLYIFEPNSTLEMSFLMHREENGLFIPLSIQRGNAFNSTVLLPSIYENKIDSSTNLLIHINNPGWYTISLNGPIIGETGRAYSGVVKNGGSQTVYLFDLDVLINVKSNNTQYTFFGINDLKTLERP